MSNIFDQLIRPRAPELVTGNVLAVDNNGARAQVRIQGENTVWASCSISVAVGDTVIIHNAGSRAVLQKLSAPAADQVTLLLV